MKKIIGNITDFYNNKRKESLIILGVAVALIVGVVAFLLFTGDPSPPEEVMATPVSHDEIRVTWIDYQNVDGYNIYRSEVPGEGYQLISSTESRHYLDEGLEPGSTYYYKVTAVRGDREGEPTRETYAQTDEAGVVTGLRAENIAYNEIEITWDDFRGSEGYTVYRTGSLDRPFAKIDTTTENRYLDTDLDSGTPYYYVVTQMVDGEESEQSSQLTVATREWLCGNNLEYDGQVYSTVKIGDRCWFAENLNYETTEGSFCYDNEEENCDRYGRLYHFDVAVKGETEEGVQGVCPDRWYVPTDDDYKEMERALGMERVDSHGTGWRGVDEYVGDKMKRSVDCSQEGEDFCGEAEFSARLSGIRSTAGTYRYRGTHAFFWTSSFDNNHAWRRMISADNSGVHREAADTENAFAVRCIRDDN